MKNDLVRLLLMGLVSVACSQTGSSGMDMGTTTQDLSATQDLATGGGAPPFTTLSLVAGAIGGPGNVDGTGPAARFYGPPTVAWDGAGNLNGDCGSGYIGRSLPTSRRQRQGAYL
jgi:hypothetical protein